MLPVTSVLAYFAELDDPRIEKNRKHPQQVREAMQSWIGSALKHGDPVPEPQPVAADTSPRGSAGRFPVSRYNQVESTMWRYEAHDAA